MSSPQIIELSRSIVSMDGFEDLVQALDRPDFSSPIAMPGPELLTEIAGRINAGDWRKARDRGELEQLLQDMLDQDPGLLRHGMISFAVFVSAECAEQLKAQKGVACTVAPKSTGESTVVLVSASLRGWLRACSSPHSHPEAQVLLRLILDDLADTAPSAFENLRYACSKDEIEAEDEVAAND